MRRERSERMSASRRMGWALIIIAILHNLIGVAVGYKQILEVFQLGLFHAARPGVFEILGKGLDQAVEGGGARAWLFWYFAFGLTLLLFGQCCLWVKELPTSLGWQLLVLGLGGEVLILSSGFWLIIFLAACFLVSRYRPPWKRSRT